MPTVHTMGRNKEHADEDVTQYNSLEYKQGRAGQGKARQDKARQTHWDTGSNQCQDV